MSKYSNNVPPQTVQTFLNRICLICSDVSPSVKYDMVSKPFLSEQVSATADMSVRVKDIRWVTNNLFLFTYNDGLYEEEFQKGGQVNPMSKIDGGPIDHDTAVNYKYDFAAPPQP